tara:strand:- start:7293 stop:8735 length:1443 start_codon:yes stop_codon:yes gene_type:complete
MEHDLAIYNLPESWQLTSLGELLDRTGGSVQTGPFGSQLHASDYVDTGIPSVMPKNISVEKIDSSDIARVSQEDIKRLAKYQLAEGDIVYSRRGDVEKCALVGARENGWLCGTGCLRVRLGEVSEISPVFLHAYLSSPAIREWLSRNAIGATMPNLNTSILRDVPLLIPDQKTIEMIESCWESINKRLILSESQNQTLEQMAQALFKSWFVDFDPVVDNALAASNPIPDELAHRVEVRKKAHALPDFQPLPEHTRSLFPSEFEQTDEPTVGIDGWVPKGWSVMSLGDVTKELRRGISPKYTDEGGVQVVNQKCIRNHEVNYALSRRNDPTLRKVDGREIEVGDVLVNSTGVGTLGRLAQVNAVPEPTVVDSHVTVVRPNPQICPIYFFGQLMVSNERSIESLGEGSTGQTELSRRILAEQLVLVPPYEQAMLIEGQLKSLSDKSSLNLKQNSALAKLRDTLLPKLISGEINIKDTKECNG